MIDEYFKLWSSCRGAFRNRSVWERAARLGTGSLLCLGRHSVTGLISATGMQNKDWSADYRVFEKERIDGEMIFGKIRQEVISRLPDSAPLVTFMDDTLIRKILPSSKKIEQPCDQAGSSNAVYPFTPAGYFVADINGTFIWIVCP